MKFRDHFRFFPINENALTCCFGAGANARPVAASAGIALAGPACASARTRLLPALAIALAVASATALGVNMAAAGDRVIVADGKAMAAGDVPASAAIVNIEKMKYDRTELHVKAGDAVYWINREVMPHNIAFRKGVVTDASFKSDMLKKGQALSIIFNKPGTYDYHCTPHPFMRGKVIVE